MARIFLSHSSRNNVEAVALRQWLVSEGWDDVFLDLDPKRGITAGERWERALHEAANRCEAVLIVVSRAWCESRWCVREFDLARKLNKRVFGVLVEEVPFKKLPRDLVENWQLIDLASGSDHRLIDVKMPGSGKDGHATFSRHGLEGLKEGLTRAGLDPRHFAWPPPDDPDRAPYRGLEPLDAADAGIFFGRDAPVIAVLDALRGLREAPPPRLFVILGASGAGKSSFLRAGILPRLARDDRNFLTLPVVRPEGKALNGTHGFVEALSAACVRLGVRISLAAIREASEKGAEALRPILKEIAAGAAAATKAAKPPVIAAAIDQAEELFRAEGEPEGERLLTLLRDLAAADDPAIAVVFCIRTDSYDALERARPLEGLGQQTYALLPMPRGAYQIVIEGPARRLARAGRKLDIDPGLTEALLKDIEKDGGGDALPLLAFTLGQLFHECHGAGRLTRADYEKLGGLGGAIGAAIERAFADADSDPRIPKDQGARLALLRRGLIPWLAGVDPESRTPRRRVARATQIPLEARPLIDLLVKQRLLTRDADAKTGETTLEPAHEALLRQWGSIKGWLEEDFGRLATLEGVKRASRDWDANARAKAWAAHGGARLEEADRLDLRPDLAGLMDATDRAYLSACRAAERSRKRSANAGSMVGGLFMVALCILTAEQYFKWRDAQPWGTLTNLFNGRVSPLSGGSVTIGRSAGPISNKIDLPDRNVSRLHLFLSRDRNAIDARSLNGTTIDARFLPYGYERKIEDGDIVALGGAAAFRFRAVGPPLLPLPWDGAPETPARAEAAWAVLIDGKNANALPLTADEYFLSADAGGFIGAEVERSEESLLRIRKPRAVSEDIGVFSLSDRKPLLAMLKYEDRQYYAIKMPAADKESHPFLNDTLAPIHGGEYISKVVFCFSAVDQADTAREIFPDDDVACETGPFQIVMFRESAGAPTPAGGDRD